MTTKDDIIAKLMKRGWQKEAAERRADLIMAGDRYEEDPLAAAGFRLVYFTELGTVAVGTDGKCICTKAGDCMDRDRKDGNRCTLKDLDRLDSEARRRRAYQSGGEDY